MAEELPYVLTSMLSHSVATSDLRIRKITALQSGDHIVASLVEDDAKESDLRIIAYDDIDAAPELEFAIGSLVEDAAYEHDLRVIPMPSVSNWIDMIPDLRPLGSSGGTISEGKITSECVLHFNEIGEIIWAYSQINVEFTGTVVGVPTALRVVFDKYVSDLEFSWNNNDFFNPIHDLTTITSNPFEWTTAWNGYDILIKSPTIDNPTSEDLDALEFIISDFGYK